MSALKTLIVGFGGIARGLATDKRMAEFFPIATHAQAIQSHDGFEWVGVVDPDQAARQSAEDDWRVSGFKKVADAAHLEPDILILATPPGSRAEALAALPSVRGVLAEKPLGNADGEALIEQARARAIPLQVNYWRRGDATLGTLASGELTLRIGKLQAGTGVYGNGLDNNGSHLIDMIRMLLGEPLWVQAIGDTTPLHGGPLTDDIHIAFALGFQGGAVITVHPLEFKHYREVALDLWGTNSRLSLQQETLDIRHLPRTANRGLDNEYEIAANRGAQLPCTVASALPNLYQNLHDAVQLGDALLSPGTSAIKSERVIALIRQSAAEGNPRLIVPGDA